MISDKTIIECASDAVSYAQQLNVIFNRCTPNGAYGDSEDYAIHKIGKPIAVNNPDN